MTEEFKTDQAGLTAMIVSAYVSKNSVRPTDLSDLIVAVYGSLGTLIAGPAATVVEEVKEPAVPVKKSVTPDFIICLEDGKKFKSLKRHLRTSYGMSPEQYRAKWNLPRDYPMVAPAYASTRSALAKQSGLGQQRPGYRLKDVAKKMMTAPGPAKRGPGRPRSSAA